MSGADTNPVATPPTEASAVVPTPVDAAAAAAAAPAPVVGSELPNLPALPPVAAATPAPLAPPPVLAPPPLVPALPDMASLPALPAVVAPAPIVAPAPDAAPAVSTAAASPRASVPAVPATATAASPRASVTATTTAPAPTPAPVVLEPAPVAAPAARSSLVAVPPLPQALPSLQSLPPLVAPNMPVLPPLNAVPAAHPPAAHPHPVPHPHPVSHYPTSLLPPTASGGLHHPPSQAGGAHHPPSGGANSKLVIAQIPSFHGGPNSGAAAPASASGGVKKPDAKKAGDEKKPPANRVTSSGRSAVGHARKGSTAVASAEAEEYASRADPVDFDFNITPAAFIAHTQTLVRSHITPQKCAPFDAALRRRMIILLQQSPQFTEVMRNWFTITDNDKSGLLSYDEARSGLYLMIASLYLGEPPFAGTAAQFGGGKDLPPPLPTAINKLVLAVLPSTVDAINIPIGDVPRSVKRAAGGDPSKAKRPMAPAAASRWLDATLSQGVTRDVFEHMFLDCLEDFWTGLSYTRFDPRSEAEMKKADDDRRAAKMKFEDDTKRLKANASAALRQYDRDFLVAWENDHYLQEMISGSATVSSPSSVTSITTPTAASVATPTASLSDEKQQPASDSKDEKSETPAATAPAAAEKKPLKATVKSVDPTAADDGSFERRLAHMKRVIQDTEVGKKYDDGHALVVAENSKKLRDLEGAFAAHKQTSDIELQSIEPHRHYFYQCTRHLLREAWQMRTGTFTSLKPVTEWSQPVIDNKLQNLKNTAKCREQDKRKNAVMEKRFARAGVVKWTGTFQGTLIPNNMKIIPFAADLVIAWNPEFRSHSLRGSGKDRFGDFTLRGTFFTQSRIVEVRFVKMYDGSKAKIDYKGVWADGIVKGTWALASGNDFGPFVLAPATPADVEIANKQLITPVKKDKKPIVDPTLDDAARAAQAAEAPLPSTHAASGTAHTDAAVVGTPATAAAPVPTAAAPQAAAPAAAGIELGAIPPVAGQATTTATAPAAAVSPNDVTVTIKPDEKKEEKAPAPAPNATASAPVTDLLPVAVPAAAATAAPVEEEDDEWQVDEDRMDFDPAADKDFVFGWTDICHLLLLDTLEKLSTAVIKHDTGKKSEKLEKAMTELANQQRQLFEQEQRHEDAAAAAAAKAADLAAAAGRPMSGSIAVPIGTPAPGATPPPAATTSDDKAAAIDGETDEQRKQAQAERDIELAEAKLKLERATEVAELAYRATDTTNLTTYIWQSVVFALQVIFLPVWLLPVCVGVLIEMGALWGCCCFIPMLTVYSLFSSLYYIGFVNVVLYNLSDSNNTSSNGELTMRGRIGFLEAYLPFIFSVIAAFFFVNHELTDSTERDAEAQKLSWSQAELEVAQTNCQMFQPTIKTLQNYNARNLIDRFAADTEPLEDDRKFSYVSHPRVLVQSKPQLFLSRDHMSSVDRHVFELVLDPYLPSETGFLCNRCKIVYKGFGYHCTECAVNRDTGQGYDVCPPCWLKASPSFVQVQLGRVNAAQVKTKEVTKTATSLVRNLSIAQNTAKQQQVLQQQQQQQQQQITVTPVKPNGTSTGGAAAAAGTEEKKTPGLGPQPAPGSGSPLIVPAGVNTGRRPSVTIKTTGEVLDDRSSAFPMSPLPASLALATSGGSLVLAAAPDTPLVDGRATPADRKLDGFALSASPQLAPRAVSPSPPPMGRPESNDVPSDSKAAAAPSTPSAGPTSAAEKVAQLAAAATAASGPTVSAHVLVKKAEQEDLVQKKPMNLSRVVLRSANAIKLEDEFVTGDYVIAAIIAAVHCLIPGFYRVFKLDVPFGGINSTERVITALHIIVAFPAVCCGCLLLRWINSLYITRARKLKLVGDVTSAQDALKSGLDGYLELDTPNHLDAWLKLRRVALTPDPAHRQVIGFLAPTVLANLGLLATMIIRTVFLKQTFDEFNVMGFFDMVVLDFYLVSIVLYVVKCNELIDEHVKILEREKLNVAKLMSIADEKDKYHYELLNLLMEASVTKLKHVPESITILGAVVDASLVTSFVIAAAGGIGTAISKVITG